MESQLHLLGEDGERQEWRLSPAMRETGRRGIERARAALAAAARDRLGDEPASDGISHPNAA
jgi:hypothetical protein